MVLLATLTLAPAPVWAQKDLAACRPLIEAEKKQIETPHHVYMVDGSGSSAKKHESISAGGVMYIQVGGKWRRSPLSLQDMREQLEQNLATATVYTCQHVGDESVTGTAASVYTAHTENEGVKADVRTWVAKGTGLVLRQEEDMDTGDGEKRHLSLRYEYTNVQAPPGVP
jgi:hypothetical protein